MDEQNQSHRLCLEERSRLTLWGVTQVIHFEDTQVVLETARGTLCIGGREFQLRTLAMDGGKMELTGQVDAMEYAEPRRRRLRR